MTSPRPIPLAHLQLDPHNPRLAGVQASQVDACRAMLTAEGPATLKLAADIAKNGYSPADLLLVIPAEESKRFIVVDGNRRLTALRLLGEPQAADLPLTPVQAKALGSSAKRYREGKEVKEVWCLEFASREEANDWVERKHNGSQGGLGTVQWGAIEKARFEEMKSGKSSPELQAIDFVAKHSEDNPELQSMLHEFPITNLKRLLRDRAVRDRLGLSIQRGVLLSQYPPEEAVKPLRRIIEDLANKRVQVEQIYNSRLRKAYLDKLPKSVLPSTEHKSETFQPVLEQPWIEEAPDVPTKKRRKRKVTIKRQTIVPHGCSLTISNRKCVYIFDELRDLRTEQFRFSVSVMLRVFIELSVDAHINKHRIGDNEHWKENAGLESKLKRVIAQLREMGRLTEEQKKCLLNMLSPKGVLAIRVSTMHAFVHDLNAHPPTTDLFAAWDNFEPLLTAIWSGGKSAN